MKNLLSLLLSLPTFLRRVKFVYRAKLMARLMRVDLDIHWGDGPDPAGTGTLLRRPLLERYALDAGFSSVEDAGVPHEGWTFWRLRG